MAGSNGRATALERITPEIRRLERAGNEETADALRAVAVIVDDFAHETRQRFDTLEAAITGARTSMNRVWGSLLALTVTLGGLMLTIGLAIAS